MSRRQERTAINFKGGITFPSRYSGVSQINSGSTTQVVSASGVSSNNKAILITPYISASGQVNSGTPMLATGSLVPGVSFSVIAAHAPTNNLPFSYLVMR